MWLGGCNQESNQNTLTPIELSDREETISNAALDNLYGYEYIVDEEKFSSANLWVETYEGADFQKEETFLRGKIEEDGLVLFGYKKSFDTNIPSFVLSTGGASLTTYDQQPETEQYDWSNAAQTMTSNGHMDITPGEEQVIVVIGYTFESNSISGVSSEFLEDMDSNLDEAEQYDLMHVVKVLFE